MLRALLKILLGLVAVLALIVGVGNWLFPGQMAQFAAAAEREAAGLERKEIKAGDFQIAYLDGGQGEPLILVHGFGADKDNWTRVSKYLTPRYRVIAPDLPGFGESSKPDGAHYTFDDQVEYLHSIVQALGLKQVNLGGNSMGGCIAALYGAKYPDEVKSLWLLAPACVSTAQTSEFGELLAKGGDNPLLVRTPSDFDRTIAFAMTEPPYVPGPIKKALADRAAANFTLHARIFQELMKSDSALEKRVAGLATPTHVLWGDRDRLLDVSGAKILGGLMPKASITVLPGIGHLPMIEKPRASAEDYLAFRASLP
jgi:abhydrolase domain-containing protein 6